MRFLNVTFIAIFERNVMIPHIYIAVLFVISVWY